MIDIGSTVLEVSRDSETQKEIEDVARCLHVLYTTPMGSQEGNRLLGIDRSVCLDKPMEIAKSFLTAEIVEKTAEFEPRAQVLRVDWLESDAVHGEVIPKVVWQLVEN